MEEQLRAVLLASAPVDALVDGRINWTEHPQGKPYPAIVLHGISDVEETTLDGPAGISDARVQVDCFGYSFGEAKQLSRAVRRLLSGYRAPPLQGVIFLNSRDGRAGEAVGADRIYAVSLDFMVKYSTGD